MATLDLKDYLQLAGMLTAIAVLWGSYRARFKALEDWKASHELQHKEDEKQRKEDERLQQGKFDKMSETLSNLDKSFTRLETGVLTSFDYMKRAIEELKTKP